MTFNALNVLLLILLGLSITLLLAPLEALAWWAGWRDEDDITSSAISTQAADKFAEDSPKSEHVPKHFIVFIDGISKGSYRDINYVTDFLSALQDTLPKSRIIGGVLPYSVFNLELTSRDYPFSRFWVWVERRKDAGNPLGYLINFRNLLQVMVSADWRYGPLYHVGMTRLILRHLLWQGYDPHAVTEQGRATSITLIGYSSGGQVAAGVAPLLTKTLKAPVKVISIAGVIAGNADFGSLERWVQIVSNRDPVEKLGAAVFPLRWRVAWFSPWNRAKRRGVVELVRSDGMRHDGDRSYMDKKSISNGRSHLERTVEVVVQVVSDERG